MAKKFLSNNWVITVGGGLLVILLLRLIDWLFINNLFWGKIKTIFNIVLEFFNTTYSVKLYWLILIPIIVLLTIILILYIFSLFSSNNNNNEVAKNPDWINYTKDVFDGLQYRWKYNFYNKEYQINVIQVYCNSCNCPLVNGTCPNCNKMYDFSMYNSQLKSEDEIKALIVHRIENNLYKD